MREKERDGGMDGWMDGGREGVRLLDAADLAKQQKANERYGA